MSNVKWNKPSLLMLVDCVPSRTGSRQQVEAWRQVELAAIGHTVSLACLARGPVHISQWRSLRTLTTRLDIQPAGNLWSWLGVDFRLASSLRRCVEQWCRDVTFDAVFCNHAALWSAMPTDRVVRRITRQALADVRLPQLATQRLIPLPIQIPRTAPLAVAA